MIKQKNCNGLRFLSLFLCVALLMTSVNTGAITAKAATGNWSTGINSTAILTADGTFTVTGTSNMKTYSAAAVPWASVKSSIKNVVIGEGIKNVSANSFADCTNLESVTFPSTLLRIESNAFARCTKLTSVELPDGLTTVDGFSYSGLTEVTIPSTVSTVLYGAFSYCENLSSVQLQEGLLSIETMSLAGCNALESIDIPDSVISLSLGAFNENMGLKEINVGINNATYKSIDGVLFKKDGKTLLLYPKGKGDEYTIPDEVEIIGATAFYSSTLTSIKIPSNVTAIGASAFHGSSKLTSIELSDNLVEIGSDAFGDCVGLTSVDIPASVTKLGGLIFRNCTGLTSFSLNGNTTNLDMRMFDGATNLQEIIIENSNITMFGTTSTGLTSFKTFKATNSDIIVNRGSFEGSGIETLDLSGDKIIIKSSAACMIPTLKTVRLNGNSVSLESSSLSGNKALKSVDIITDNLTIDSGGTFRGDISLSSLNIPDLKEVPGYMFADCNLLPNVDFISDVTSIGDYAFQNSSTITSVTITEAVTSVGASAFAGATKLVNIYFYSPTTTIGANAIPKTTIVHGVESSTAKAYANANGLVFELMEDSSPKVNLQNLTYDKYQPRDIAINYNLGVGELKATGLSSVKVGDTVLDSSKYNASSTKVVIDKSVFEDMEVGTSSFITVTFDDFSETTLKNAKVKIADTTPFKDPTVTVKTHTFDRLNPTDLVWGFDYGTEGTAVELYINETLLDSSNYSLGKGTISLSKDYLNSLVNDTYEIKFKFNDTKETTVVDSVEITGIETILPVVETQNLKYTGSELVYTVGHGNIATEITKLTVNGIGLPISYYSITDDILTISNEYLSVTDNGLYVISLEYNDGTIINDKLTFTIPKDTSSITPQNSILNILYINGSTTDLSIPLADKPTDIASMYVDSSLVDPQNYNFDAVKSVLTISSELLNAIGLGSHSMIISLNYVGKMRMMTLAEPGDTGIIISSINSGTTGLTYKVDENGNAIIDGYEGDETDVEIPSDIDGAPVTGIEDLGDTPIDSVTIPGTVTDITDGAIPPSTEIIAPEGSAGDNYATDNGNPYTPNEGGTTTPGDGTTTPGDGENASPSIPSQTVEYDVNKPSDVTITGVNLGDATAIDYITIGNYKIYSDGTVELITEENSFTGMSFKEVSVASGSAIGIVSGSAIEFTGVPYTLDEDGKLVISAELLALLELDPTVDYEIEIGFNDGTIIRDAVSMDVVDTYVDPTDPTDPTDPSEPTKPIDPTDPSEPTKPTDPTDPGEPTKPIDPTDPSEPNDNGGNNGSSNNGGNGSNNGGSNSGSNNGNIAPTPIIKLPEGVKDEHVDLSKPEEIEDIVVDVDLGDTTGKDIIVDNNGEDLDKDKYTYDNDKNTIIIDKDAIKEFNEGKNDLSVRLEDSTGKTVDKQEIAHVEATKNYSIQEINRTITKGSKINVNIIKRSKNSKVMYTSSNKKVATITKSNGILTAKKAGNTVITITSVDKGKTTIYKINVKVTNSQGNKNILDTNRTVYLKGTMLLNTKAKDVKFTVKNNKLLSINKYGKVTPKKVGATTIKVAETTDQLQFVYTQKVNVRKPYIKLTRAVKALKSKKSFNFNATSYDSIQEPIEWFSSNESVATIDYKTGLVKAIKKGTTTLVTTCGESVKTIKLIVK